MANAEQIKQFIQKTRNKAKFLRQIDPRVIILLAIPLVVVILIFASIVTIVKKSAQPSQADVTPDTSILKPNGIAQINKDFSFSLKSAAGKDVGSFSFTLQNAELDKQIIVKGARATAIPGRIFLIVNLKLTNTQDQGLQVNTRDYIRLSLNGNTKELLAPEIHNDPVEVQAISTNFTRVGFAIYESDKDYVLKVGEIDGKKQDITLHFK